MSKQPKSYPVSLEDVRYVIGTQDISVLEGRTLTLIDASISDPVQRKAMKDMARPMIWQWAIEANHEPGHPHNDAKLQ